MLRQIRMSEVKGRINDGDFYIGGSQPPLPGIIAAQCIMMPLATDARIGGNKLSRNAEVGFGILDIAPRPQQRKRLRGFTGIDR